MKVYPEYLTDPAIIVCPSDSDGNYEDYREGNVPDGLVNPCMIRDLSYAYYTWAFRASDVFTDPASSDNPDATVVDLSGDFIGGLTDVITRISTDWFDDADDTVYKEDISSGNMTIYRFREGIERFFITDINNPAASSVAQSELATVQDDFRGGENISWSNHVPGGSNILYMDGHVEFIRYPGEFPISPGWIVVIELL